MVKFGRYLMKTSLVPLSFLANAAAWAQAQAAPAVNVPAKGLFVEEISTAKKIIDMVAEFTVVYSFQMLGGIVVIIVGYFASKFFGKVVAKLLHDRKVDITVAKFAVTVVKMSIMAFAVLVALGKFGITIAPFIAGLSAIGFGMSFALQGPLSNYAAGATLIFTKPFKVGDIVEVAGVVGEVTDMTLSCTELKTIDNTIIFVPNKQVIGEIIHNYTEFKKMDLKVGIAYEADVEKAIRILKEIAADDARIAKIPEPRIGISEFGDSSVNVYGRLWCHQDKFWDIKFDINMKIFKKFAENGISIPFPRRDIHIYEEGKK